MDKPRLVATDVDGTLLRPDEQLSTRTHRAVRGAAADGVAVVLVSGRPPRAIVPVAEYAGLGGLAVCSNGSALYDLDAGAVLELHGLEPGLLRDCADALSGVLPDCRLGSERIGVRGIDGEVPRFVSEPGYHNPWGDPEEVVRPRAEVLAHTSVKLLVSDPAMSSDAMAEAARGVLDGVVDITFSAGGGLIELAKHGISKATGLAEVAGRLGVAAEESIAFGDMPNDVEMLRWAGHGVAVANAHPEVHDAADETTAPNTADGVAQVLERWF